MPQFTLTINLGNDAMCFPADVARALKHTATNVHYTDLNELMKHPGRIVDDNGNVVGHYEVI